MAGYRYEVGLADPSPVLAREPQERRQRFQVVDDTGDRPGILGLPRSGELLGAAVGLGHPRRAMSRDEVSKWSADRVGVPVDSRRQNRVCPVQMGCARQDSNLHALAGTRTQTHPTTSYRVPPSTLKSR